MWTPHSEQMADGHLLRVTIDLDSSPVSYAAVLRRWQHDEDFRSFFITLLADSPFSAFRWETPPITTATANRPFEFTLLDSPGLARKPDIGAFAEHFKDAVAKEVVEFANMGKDAIMIVPCPNGPLSKLTVIWVHSSGRHQSAETRGCGDWWARRCNVGSAPSLFGSARRGAVCRGCTCGSTTGPSITVTNRIGSPPKTGSFEFKNLNQRLQLAGPLQAFESWRSLRGAGG